MKNEIFRIERGVYKSTPSESMYDFSFQIFEHEITGIITGSDLETNIIVDILCGNQRLHYGWVYYEEDSIPLEQSADFLHQKIYSISNGIALAENMTVKENIFLLQGKHKLFSRINTHTRKAKALFNKLSIPFSLDTQIKYLSVFEKRLTEILKAYIAGYRIIILNNLDNVLNSNNIATLFHIISLLQKENVDFIFFSNNEDLLFTYTECIYVLQHGRLRKKLFKNEYTKNYLYTVLMSGLSSSENILQSTPGINHLMEVCNYSNQWMSNISFHVNETEIVNFVNLDIEKADFYQLFLSIQNRTSGTIMIGNKPYLSCQRKDLIKQGICIIDQMPQQTEYYFNTTILENICINVQWSTGNIPTGLSIFEPLCKTYEAILLGKNIFTYKELHENISEASNETIIKMAYYRWILCNPQVLICNRPFMTNDESINKLTRQLLYQALQHNLSVIIYTDTLSEATRFNTRTIILKNRRIEQK